MAHFAPVNRKRKMIIMGAALAIAFAAIIFMTWWAGTQINEYANEPEQGSTPPVATTPSETPTPTTEMIDGPVNEDGIHICPPEWQTTSGDGCNEPDVGTIVIGPNGETCKVVDEKGNMSCNLPDIPGAEPLPSCD